MKPLERITAGERRGREGGGCHRAASERHAAAPAGQRARGPLHGGPTRGTSSLPPGSFASALLCRHASRTRTVPVPYPYRLAPPCFPLPALYALSPHRS